MATQANVTQSTREEKVYPLDFSPSLLEDVSIVDVDINYEGDNTELSPPITNVDIDAASNIAYVAISNLSVGEHRFGCVAQTTNDNLSPEIMLLITVKF